MYIKQSFKELPKDQSMKRS